MATVAERPPAPAQRAHDLAPPAPGASVYSGLFAVTLATLMLEILLTRIFSVILWYHFAFVAVSVALFGMTLGAVIVHLAPRYFAGPALASRLAGASLLFGVTAVAALALALSVKFSPPQLNHALLALGPLYLLVAVPFTFSGIVVSVVLTRFPSRVNRLYAADLLGAAAGCIAIVVLLDLLDAPSAVIAVGAIAVMGGVAFSLGTPAGALRAAAALSALALIGFAALNSHGRLLRVRWLKGKPAGRVLYERWNSFSRIAVTPRGRLPIALCGANCPRGYRVSQKGLDIDASASTVLTHFDGDLKPLGYLPYDISAAAHWLRPGAEVLVIGIGGGRDILTALAMRQRSVTGVELNPNIVAAVNGRYGAFTGHLDRVPNVRFVTDEARSWIDRSHRRFDIIQCSLIDTWAATAAGAFVLSENSLYTREAWVSILNHLTDRGIFSVTRWYVARKPGEMLRCLSLARASLAQLGVPDARRHLAIIRLRAASLPRWSGGHGLATLLVSRAAFTAADVRRLEDYARRVGFEIVLSPRVCRQEQLARLLSAPRLRDFTDGFSLDLSPPTDDRPFFFNMLRLRDWAAAQSTRQGGKATMNLQAVSVLGSLLVVTIGLAAFFIVVPLALTQRRDRYSVRSLAPGLLFFAAIGLGFMLVEISQMQRLVVFLGHPVYGLSVVLFALLGASGLGSLAAGSVAVERRGQWRIAAIMGALLALLALFGAITPALTQAARAWPTSQRIALAVALLAPIGFLMGAPFPLGMELASRSLARSVGAPPTAWLWGINGATSVVASVAAVALALAVGISATFFVGVACYTGATLFLMLLSRQV